ncbi:MAG: lipocalin family protein [Desulfarculus sp.]|nr:lipocalin family protein [Desulfarculus sp.]
MLRRAALLLLMPLLLAGCGGPALAPPGVAVERVNLVLYQGLWHEVASSQPWYQEGCVCTQARYTLHGEELVIKNTCRRHSAQGQEYARTGLAAPVPGTGGAQLSVSFHWPFRGGYWVIGLDPDYQWALVGSPDRRNVWVLAREPRLDPGLLARLLETAKQKGFDTSRVRMTEQECGK